MRTLLARGSIGETVKSVQRALATGGFNTSVDGWFGDATEQAVRAFQKSKSLEDSGAIDEGTWQLLMNKPVPSVSDRCLQLTAAFEGHGFGLAVGNFDGALLTWGIIGFTMASGEVPEIILAINRKAPEKVQQAFGPNSKDLLRIIQAAKPEQALWANEVTASNGSLVEPWRTMFATFGNDPEVQAEQVKRVHSDYLAPAIKTAQMLRMQSELSLALCFDIHVQNGGIKNLAMKAIAQQSSSVKKESDLRMLIANAVADTANAKWRDDVRQRKLTIATGAGVVHGHNFKLINWGLSGDYAAAELCVTSVAGRNNAA